MKFKGQPVAEAVAKQAAEKPEDTGTQEMFQLQLKQMLEADQAFKAEIQKLLEAAKAAAPADAHASGQGVVATTGGVAVRGNVEGGIRTQPTRAGQTGTAATATDEGVAASSGGVAVRGTVKGGITVGGATPEPTKAEPPAEKKN